MRSVAKFINIILGCTNERTVGVLVLGGASEKIKGNKNVGALSKTEQDGQEKSKKRIAK